jgi:LCP family protein required for cell wall assembly
MTMQSRRQSTVRRKKKTLNRTTLFFGFLSLLLIGLLIGVFIIGFKLIFVSQDSQSGQPENNADPNQVQYQIPSGEKAEVPLQASGGPSAKSWDGSKRVTALFMGLDYRDWEAGNGASRTDSMMLVSYDPETNTAGMLSIPRDLWVAIPGFGEAKINTAYYLGETYNIPGGGPALAVQTVEQFLSVPIDFYAQVDFKAFEKFIDSLGGLDIKIREPITIDPLGPGNTKTLEPGTQTLTGAETLAYARQRNTDHGDIDRAQRQQDVLISIRNQILNLNMLPGLISKSPQLYADVASGLRTNLTLSQVVKIAIAAINVPKENIKQVVIGVDETELSISYDGQSILLPYMEKIIEKRDLLFGRVNTPPANTNTDTDTNTNVVPSSDQTGDQAVPVTEPAPEEDFGAKLAAENARIVVLNGTKTEGLASRFKVYLEASNIQIQGTGNVDPGYSGIILIDHTGKVHTIKFLSQMMNIPETKILNQSTSNGDSDIDIIIGENWDSYFSLP